MLKLTLKLLLCVVQQVNGYSYTENLEMQERLPMLTADQRDVSASAGKHEMRQPDHTDQSAATVLFTCFSWSCCLCLLYLCVGDVAFSELI